MGGSHKWWERLSTAGKRTGSTMPHSRNRIEAITRWCKNAQWRTETVVVFGMDKDIQ